MENNSSKLAFKLVVYIYISILIGAALYSLLVPVALSFDRETSLTFFRKKFITVGSMSVLATWVIYLLYRPIKQCIATGACQADADTALYRKARKALITLPRFIFLVGAISYSLGVVLSLFLDARRGEMPDRSIAAGNFIAAFIWGLVNGVITERIVNIILIESKTSLKIETMKDQKAYSTLTHLFMPVTIITIWLMSYTALTFFFASTPDLSAMAWKLAVYLVLALVLVFLILTEFTLSMKNLLRQIESLSGDRMDLSRNVYITSFDDIGIVTEGMNHIIGNLRNTFSSIRQAIGVAYKSSGHTKETVDSSRKRVREMEKLMDDMQSGIDQQLGTVQQTGSTIGAAIGSIEEMIAQMDEQAEKVDHAAAEIRSMIDHMETVSGGAARTEELFQDIRRKLDQGTREVEETAEGIEKINGAGRMVADTVKVIDDIADRINLIAMNAAIESAKAGAAGKGFAVVAGEIRKLADNTSKETETITGHIATMQQITDSGLSRFASLGGSLQNIFATVEETGKSVAEIAGSSREMARRGESELTEIEELVELTGTLKQETARQIESNHHMKSAMETLSQASGSLVDLQKQLHAGIAAIESAFANISEDFDHSFSSNRKLEELVEGFHTGD
jgi:methyl-accepting chemotaxis protein